MRTPLPGPVSVATPFDPPEHRWLPGHRGVDLAGTALASVRAPADGTVVFAGAVGGRPVLSIDHGGGVRSTFEPVRARVRTGESVVAGEEIGRLLAAHPGCPVEACLHWGIRVASGGPSRDDDYVDPLALLADSEKPIRLKPILPGDGASRRTVRFLHHARGWAPRYAARRRSAETCV
ncbi:M23 family metallopeptidase [Dietzia sp. ANT_WB102]|nr:M23 family metallopeptidase [Dietzia sp. ANT_WB102]KAA0920066.1 M23 family metallopeptidase [Dietzia sp. ANT_WB102]